MTLVSDEAHAHAVARLQQSYQRLPANAPIRLAKTTSNLFRPRSAAGSNGLDVSGLAGVLEVDPVAQVADVQGMCTYEDLVATTLPFGLIPYVVPQLRTITLGGAVTGLGIESTSFRNGLPHESVLELDILTGDGRIVTATPDGDHADLFRAFPNSYGSLGYATRIRIKLERVPPYVRLRHVRFNSTEELESAIASISRDHHWQGERVDGLDGTAFAPGEYYLTLAQWSSTGGMTSDYTGNQIYYRSIAQRPTDLLTMNDYLWRWDTDWFWCSAAFKVQHPVVRRLWPRRWKRSDVYHKLVSFDRRYHILDRLDALRRRPQRERVIQDVEVPLEQLGAFLDWFDEQIGMRPVWMCPLVSTGVPAAVEPREQPAAAAPADLSGPSNNSWPTYPLAVGELYVNLGFWGTIPTGPEAPNAPHNRAIEAKVSELGGHKSLYSEAFYSPEAFNQLYDGDHLAAVKKRYDPNNRLSSLYDKVVRKK